MWNKDESGLTAFKFGTRQFLVQHLRWCEEVIVDHSESSMKKGDAPGGRSDGDFTWLTKPNVDGMCTSSWIGNAITSKRQTMFQPTEKKPAGFNVTTSPTLVTPAGPSSNWGQGSLCPTIWHRFALRCRPGFLEPQGPFQIDAIFWLIPESRLRYSTNAKWLLTKLSKRRVQRPWFPTLLCLGGGFWPSAEFQCWTVYGTFDVSCHKGESECMILDVPTED